MTTPTFNLVDEPWIKVRLLDGRPEEVSLRGLFRDAPRIRRIAGDLPTQDFAILRIALAVMYRALGSDDDFDEVWACGTLPLEEIDAYLDRWHERFDLLHPTHPFMQVAGLHSTSGDTRALSTLVPDAPGYGNLYTMRRSVPELAFADAARWLIHCQAYDFDGIKTGAAGDPRTQGGKGYPVGIGWAGWLGGLYLEGADLRETLLHNWVPSPSTRDDRALWELDPLTPSARPTIGPHGPAELFTWPIRHIRLIHEDGVVTRVLICIGDPIAKSHQHGVEPMTTWRYSEPQTRKEKSPTPLYMPQAHAHDRALWRGLTALLPAPTHRTDPKGVVLSYPSTIVERLGYRVSVGDVPNRLIGLVAVGAEYGANMSTISEIFTDSLIVHPAIAAASGSARACVVDAVKRADDAVNALARLAGDLAVADGGERSEAAAKARSTAYAALDQLFRTWLRGVDNSRDSEEMSQEWFSAARGTLLRLAFELLDSATPRSRAVRVVDGHAVSAGSSANWFNYNIKKHLPDGRKDKAK